MDMRIPRLRIQIMLESNPLKSSMLVRRLGLLQRAGVPETWALTFKVTAYLIADCSICNEHIFG